VTHELVNRFTSLLRDSSPEAFAANGRNTPPALPHELAFGLAARNALSNDRRQLRGPRGGRFWGLSGIIRVNAIPGVIRCFEVGDCETLEKPSNL